MIKVVCDLGRASPSWCMTQFGINNSVIIKSCNDKVSEENKVMQKVDYLSKNLITLKA
jgi:hypothetical protein